MNFKKYLNLNPIIIGCSAAINLTKLLAIATLCVATVLKDYSILYFIFNIWASLAGFSVVPRFTTRLIRSDINLTRKSIILILIPFRFHYFNFLIPILIFLAICRGNFELLPYVFLGGITLIPIQKFNTLTSIFYSKIGKPAEFLLSTFIRNLLVIIYILFLNNKAKLEIILILELFGGLFAIILFAYFQKISLFRLIYTWKKLTLISNRIGKNASFATFSNTASIFLGQLDNFLALTFFNPDQYKIFSFLLLTQSIGGQLNYIFSLSLASSVKNTISKIKSYINFVFLSYFLIIICGLVSFSVLFLIQLMGWPAPISNWISPMPFQYLMLASVILAITAFDYSSGLWLIKFGFKSFLHVTTVLFIVKGFLYAILGLFFDFNPLHQAILIFVVCLLSSFFIYGRLYEEIKS